jgi:hypothetical protein
MIAILEDDPDRITAMRKLLSESFPAVRIAAFDNAPEMLSWLRDNLQTVRLLLLDHDLGPNQIRGDATFDPGTGRDVANFLADCQPQCDIIIHTTNTLAAPGMQQVLEDAGWNVTRVVPYGDLDWIGEAWIDAVRRAIPEH